MFAIIGELTDYGYKVCQERLLKEAALANEATKATSSKTKQFPKSLEMLKTAPSQQKLGKAISKLFPRGDTIAQSQQKASKVKKTEAKRSLSKGAEPTPKKCTVITALILLSYQKTRLLFHEGLTSRNYQIMV